MYKYIGCFIKRSQQSEWYSQAKYVDKNYKFSNEFLCGCTITPAEYARHIGDSCRKADDMAIVLLACMYPPKIAICTFGKKVAFTSKDCTLKECDLIFGQVGVQKCLLLQERNNF